MERTFVVMLLSGVLNVVTCCIIATAILLSQDWYGSGDIKAFIIWSIALAAGVSVGGKTVITLLKDRNLFLQLFFVIIIAGVASFVGIYLMAWFYGPWMGTFSFSIIPIWIVGCFVQLLFLSWKLPLSIKKPHVIKATLRLVLLLPITMIVVMQLALFIFSFAVLLTKRTLKQTYLIPADYEGKFVVVYGENCAGVPRMENEREVMEVPKSGVLIVQSNLDGNVFIDDEFYLVDEKGTRVKANRGITKFPSVADGGRTGLGPDIHYDHFYLYNKRTTIDENVEPHRKFDELVIDLVSECRKKIDGPEK